MNAKKTTVVAICCRQQPAFIQAHRRAICEQRTSLLVTASEWRQLPSLADMFDISTIWTDEPDSASFLAFEPEHVEQFHDSFLPPTAIWPDPLAILLTSGSTGKPKAVFKSRQAIVGEIHALQKILTINTSVCLVSTVPLEHMFGYTFGFLLPQFSEMDVHPKRVLLPGELRNLCQKSAKPVWLITTPVHLRAYVALKCNFPHIAGVVCATSPLSTQLAKQAALRFGVSITEIYGSTETGAIAFRHRHADELLEPCWNPLAGIDLQVDADGRALCVAGHLDDPITLGDRLAQDGSGFRLLGREGDMIKICGKRHSRQALNSLLSGVPGVLDGSYFFPHDGNENQENSRPLAFVVLEADVTTHMVLNHLRGLMDEVFLPRPLCQLDSLPRSVTGKLSDTDLGNLYQSWLGKCGAKNKNNLELNQNRSELC